MRKPKTEVALKLTKEFIASTPTPLKGEVWLADSVVKGFGVRIWRNRSGARGMSYAVRVKDRQGKWVRQGLDLNWFYRPRAEPDFSMHIDEPKFCQAITIAREEARETIATIKGRKMRIQRRIAKLDAKDAARLNNTCKEAFKNLLLTTKQGGRSRDYTDRLDAVFHEHIPKSIQEKRLGSIEANELASVYSNSKIPESSLKLLVMIAGRLFNANGLVSSSRLLIDRGNGLESVRMMDLKSATPLVPHYNKCKAAIFQRLANEKSKTEEAICLGIYFYLFGYSIPLSSIISARWEDVFAVKDIKTSKARALIWEHKTTKRRKSVTIEGNLAVFLLAASKLPNSTETWIPSNLKSQPISFTRLTSYWHGVTAELGLPTKTPVEYVRQWRTMPNDEILESWRDAKSRYLSSAEWNSLFLSVEMRAPKNVIFKSELESYWW